MRRGGSGNELKLVAPRIKARYGGTRGHSHCRRASSVVNGLTRNGHQPGLEAVRTSPGSRSCQAERLQVETVRSLAHTDDTSTVNAITVYMRAKAICTPSRRASSAAYSLTLVCVSHDCKTTIGLRGRAT